MEENVNCSPQRQIMFSLHIDGCTYDSSPDSANMQHISKDARKEERKRHVFSVFLYLTGVPKSPQWFSIYTLFSQ